MSSYKLFEDIVNPFTCYKCGIMLPIFMAFYISLNSIYIHIHTDKFNHV